MRLLSFVHFFCYTDYDRIFFTWCFRVYNISIVARYKKNFVETKKLQLVPLKDYFLL